MITTPNIKALVYKIQPELAEEQQTIVDSFNLLIEQAANTLNIKNEELQKEKKATLLTIKNKLKETLYIHRQDNIFWVVGITKFNHLTTKEVELLTESKASTWESSPPKLTSYKSPAFHIINNVIFLAGREIKQPYPLWKTHNIDSNSAMVYPNIGIKHGDNGYYSFRQGHYSTLELAAVFNLPALPTEAQATELPTLSDYKARK